MKADPLVDPVRLAAWLDERGLGVGESLGVERITSGASNEVFVLRRAEHEWVLRRPAAGSGAKADVMSREFRVLTALEGTPVPHPAPLALCDDVEVIGAPFYVMARVDGFAPRIPLPAPFETDPSARHTMGVALVDALAALARVDWRAGGLDGFGRPDGYLDRQVDRWLGQLARVRSRDLDDVDLVATWLRAHTPPLGEAGILHGDYQLANVMIGHDLPVRVAAVVDWEQSTIGEPLVDLGWLLALWDEPGEEPVRGGDEVRVNQQDGFPTRAELAERYSASTGRALDHLGWYEVLALFKLGCVLEGAYARFAAGTSTNPAHARLEHMVPNLFRSAARIVERGGQPR
jgi:aminoglycoside phosphotransferase (APT) family kinase protein